MLKFLAAVVIKVWMAEASDEVDASSRAFLGAKEIDIGASCGDRYRYICPCMVVIRLHGGTYNIC